MTSTQMKLGLDLGLPQDAVDVNGRVWFRDLDGNRAVFVDQDPFYCYPLDDPVLHRFCAIQLVEAGLVKVCEICRAFEIHDRAFSRYRSRFREQGIAGLVPGKVGRKPLETASLAAGIVQRYQDGKSTRDIAHELGISPSSVQRILRDQGVQLRPSFAQQPPLPLAVDDPDVLPAEPPEVDVETAEIEAAEGVSVEPEPIEPDGFDLGLVEREVVELEPGEPQLVEATSVPYASPLDQFATSMGLIEEAPVEYQSADGVPCAGVLLGLALLDGTHLVEEARAVYGRLKNGWYGLRSLLWTLVVMALLRIKRPEQLKHHDPASLGLVLGKGNYEPLGESEFETVSLSIPGQPAVEYELAESTLQEEGWPELRLIALKKNNGGQTHVVATGQRTWQSLQLDLGEADPSAAEIAWTMFGRWSQENWFKYMRGEYALDVLVDYSMELDDQEHLVVNPRWRELDRQVASARGRLARAQAKHSVLIMKLAAAPQPRNETDGDNSPAASNGKASQYRELQKRCNEQAAEVSKLSVELDRVRAARKATAKKIPLGEADDRDKVKLSYERKLFTDTVKLAAYEIETRFYQMLGMSFSNSPMEGRGIIRALLSTSGDIRVTGDLIEVHLDQQSAPRCTHAMQSLCQHLNALGPRLPETPYELRFHIKPRPIGE